MWVRGSYGVNGKGGFDSGMTNRTDVVGGSRLEGMAISRAKVGTANAESYMRKLGQHWSHEYPVTFGPAHTCTIKLAHAVCELEATPEALNVQLTIDPGEDQARIEGVVERHIKRFGFREELEFPWQRAA